MKNNKNQYCVICHKDIINELPKIDTKGNHYCGTCYINKCQEDLKKQFRQECSLIANGEDLPTDKEKHIDNSYRAKMVENGIYKDSETTSEEMIEEIKRIIDERCEAELGQVHASSRSGKVTKTVDTKLIAKDICEYLIKDSVVQPTIQSYSTHDNDLVVLSREELEEKYEPSETFMAVVRELEELKESLKDSVVLSKEEYEKLTTPRLTKVNHKPLDEKALMQMLQQSIYYVPNDDCSIELLPTRAEIEKETVEKCNSILEKNYKDWLKVLNDLNIDTSNKNILVSIVCGLFKNSQEDIVKQFGVEIKE